MITVIVLAAGMSRRMGSKNKLLLPFRGKTMFETTVEQLSGLRGAEIIVVLGHEAEQVKPLLQNPDLQVVFNPDYATGMTSSIQAGVRAAAPETQGYMICLSDMPLIQTATYCQLAGAFLEKNGAESRIIVQPVFEGTPGNPVIFSAFYRNNILALDFPEGCKPLVQANRSFVLQVEVETDAILKDADDEEAFERL